MDFSATMVYVLIPVISAFIGWMTNRIAVRMIFRPRRAVNLLGLRIQGLIPRRRSELARSVGETVERELISHGDLQRAAQSPEFRQQIGRALRAKIDELFDRAFGGGTLASVLMTGEVVALVKDRLVRELQRIIPEAVTVMLDGMEANLSFRELVQTKIEAFEMAKLESLVYTIAARELRTIELLGGVLGLFVGLAQLAIIIVANHYA